MTTTFEIDVYVMRSDRIDTGKGFVYGESVVPQTMSGETIHVSDEIETALSALVDWSQDRNPDDEFYDTVDLTAIEIDGRWMHHGLDVTQLLEEAGALEMAR